MNDNDNELKYLFYIKYIIHHIGIYEYTADILI